MAAAGFTPISLYYTTTSGAGGIPSAGNLVNGELAINITDGKLYYKDNGGTVQVIATKATGTIGGSTTQVQYNNAGVLAGSSNLTFDGTSLTLGGNPTLSAGTANGVLYLNGSKVATSGSALTFDGTTLTAFTSPGTSNPLLVLKNNSAVSNANIVEQQFYISNNNSGNDVIAKFGAINPSATGNNYGNFYWSLANAGAPSEQMRLTSTGLGIGTSSPSYRLNVVGANGGTTNLFQVGISAVTNGFTINTDASNNIVYSFLTKTGSTGIYQDASGNLGVGTTSPSNRLHVFNSTTTQLQVQMSGQADMRIISDTGYGALSLESNMPLIFRTNATERARITSGGNFKIGGTADRGTTEGDKQLVLFNGTAPVGTLTNGISLYSSSGEAYVMDAAGNATLFSPHDRDTNEWIFRSKHTPSGKVLKIDVERLLRFVNDHFGLDAVQEFIEP